MVNKAPMQKKKQSDIINESLLCSQSQSQQQQSGSRFSNEQRYHQNQHHNESEFNDTSYEPNYEPIIEKENSPVVQEKIIDQKNETKNEFRKVSRKRKIDTSALMELKTQITDDKQKNSVSSQNNKRLKSDEINNKSLAQTQSTQMSQSTKINYNFDDDDLDLDL
jgi:hypothetical protein